MAGVAGFSAVREQDAGSAEGDGSASSEVRSGPRMDAGGGRRDGPEAHGCGREHRSGHRCRCYWGTTEGNCETDGSKIGFFEIRRRVSVHERWLGAGALQFMIAKPSAPRDWWEQCEEKRGGVCGEHIDARTRTSDSPSTRIALAGTNPRYHADLEGCEPAAWCRTSPCSREADVGFVVPRASFVRDPLFFRGGRVGRTGRVWRDSHVRDRRRG